LLLIDLIAHQVTVARESKQRLVRHRLPKMIGEARRTLVGRDRKQLSVSTHRIVGAVLDHVEEMRRRDQ
jgi:hypothetical protein